MGNGFNPGINQPGIDSWPAHQRSQFKQVVRSNHRRIRKLTDKQREHLDSLQDLWLEKCYDYPDAPDALAEALACRNVLNVVGKAK